MRPYILALASYILVGWVCFACFAADIPAHGKQTPGYYRLCMGHLEITALYDGFVDINPKLLRGVSQEDIRAMLIKEFSIQHPTGIQVSINAFLVKTESNLILVDAGAGTAFGTSAGDLQRSIEEAGYNSAEIDSILITHMHIDHFAGIVRPDGKAAFPNATIYLSRAEAEDSLRGGVYDLPMRAIAPYMEMEHFKTFVDGQAILPRVKTVYEIGHTRGMAGYLFDTGADPLLLWGDLVHVFSVQFPHPEISIEFDENQSAAITTRRKIMNQAAVDKFMIASPHLPFPGLGHIEKEGEGYRWIPLEYVRACGV